jgi:hypothetical protein
MKKIFLSLLIFSWIINLFSFSNAHANDIERKGLFVGGGPRVGYVSDIKRTYGGADFSLGWGINDSLLLSYTGTVDVTYREGLTYYAFDNLFEAQLFLNDAIYFSAGVGYSVGEMALLGIYNLDTKSGVVVNSGLGYEFLVGDNFGVAPEINYTYRRLGSYNFHSLGASLQMKWYF